MGRLLTRASHTVAALLALAACTGQDGNRPFAIRLALDTELGGCLSERCDDFGMRCGARVSVRIVVASSGEVVSSTCAEVAPSETLCGLGNLPPGASVFFDLPPEMLRIEVATWNQDVLDNAPDLGGECPGREIFDLQGIPLTSFSPQPAFAGAVYFDAGSEQTEAVVPLACTDPSQLDTTECAPPVTQLVTEVTDVERLRQAADADADGLLVRAAAPRTRIEGDGTVTVIDTAGAIVLDREAGEGARFSTLVSGSISGNLCSLVLEQTAQATTSVVCDRPKSSDVVQLQSALLPKPVLDQVLAAVGLSEFPQAGLVVGRAFDSTTGAPLSGVTMVPDEVGAGAVQYLDSSRTGTLGDRTFDNGYFIAQGIPFGTHWSATSDDGLVADGSLVAGDVEGHVSVLLVPMK